MILDNMDFRYATSSNNTPLIELKKVGRYKILLFDEVIVSHASVTIMHLRINAKKKDQHVKNAFEKMNTYKKNV